MVVCFFFPSLLCSVWAGREGGRIVRLPVRSTYLSLPIPPSVFVSGEVDGWMDVVLLAF